MTNEHPGENTLEAWADELAQADQQAAYARARVQELAFQAVTAGGSVRAVAARVGVSGTTVANWVARHRQAMASADWAGDAA